MEVPLWPTDTVVIPLDKPDNLSNECRANKNHGFKNINDITKDILNLKGDLLMYHSQNCFNENDVKDQQKFKVDNNYTKRSKSASSKTNQSLRARVLEVCLNTP